ncbi:hypothetical protein phiV141_5 [Vibrio phage phiV141]|uniref:Uncharacterized protein n=1 Tax=Vibrio phage phiV141 TaxID=2723905 RepID=A0A7D7IB93_9CAUD|nr:hypothetical protein phiV141_5 [Vibrio phage phiV141]
MLSVEVWEPKEHTSLPTGLPEHGKGRNTYIIDVYNNPADTPPKLYRAWLHSYVSVDKARETAQQYPEQWEALWKEKFMVQQTELYPLEMIYKVAETDMSTEQKLYLIDLICKEQLSDNN